MHRFFAPPESFAAAGVSLDEHESRHLRTVVRLREGDAVFVFDGEGAEFRCRVGPAEGRRQLLTVESEVRPRSPESPLHLTLAPALLKGEKFDLVVQKAVELGVSQLVPLSTERCDVKLIGSENRLDRWERIALEATKQCGRAKLMRVSPPVIFDELLRGSKEGVCVLFAESGGSEFRIIPSASNITALVGPEGGWSEQELEKAKHAGFSIITFGGRILRAETASIAITAMLQHRFGDLN